MSKVKTTTVQLKQTVQVQTTTVKLKQPQYKLKLSTSYNKHSTIYT
jgi:hypothetical protein